MRVLPYLYLSERLRRHKYHCCVISVIEQHIPYLLSTVLRNILARDDVHGRQSSSRGCSILSGAACSCNHRCRAIFFPLVSSTKPCSQAWHTGQVTCAALRRWRR